MAPETTLRFFSCTGETHSSLVFSPSQRHHYRSFNDISCTFPCNLHALPLFSHFSLTFPLRNDRSRAQPISAAWPYSSFTQLHTEITPAARTLHRAGLRGGNGGNCPGPSAPRGPLWWHLFVLNKLLFWKIVVIQKRYKNTNSIFRCYLSIINDFSASLTFC